MDSVYVLKEIKEMKETKKNKDVFSVVLLTYRNLGSILQPKRTVGNHSSNEHLLVLTSSPCQWAPVCLFHIHSGHHRNAGGFSCGVSQIPVFSELKEAAGVGLWRVGGGCALLSTVLRFLYT